MENRKAPENMASIGATAQGTSPELPIPSVGDFVSFNHAGREIAGVVDNRIYLYGEHSVSGAKVDLATIVLVFVNED